MYRPLSAQPDVFTAYYLDMSETGDLASVMRAARSLLARLVGLVARTHPARPDGVA